MFRSQHPIRTQPLQQEGKSNTGEYGNKGRWENSTHGRFGPTYFVRQNQQEQRKGTDSRGGGRNAPECVVQSGKGVLVGGLHKIFVPHEVHVVAHQVRDLLHDQDNPDGRHHAFNHGVGNVVPDGSQFGQAKEQLEKSRQNDCRKKEWKRSEVGNCHQYDGRQACSRAGNADG